MAKRATTLLAIALLLGGCFKPEYKGDLLFACDPNEGLDKSCPEGYACTHIAGIEPRCHRRCDPLKENDCHDDLKCLPFSVGPEPVHVCVPEVPPPGKDAGPDGKVPTDAPQPVSPCTGHYVLGKLADHAETFDLVSVTDDHATAVWIDDQNHLLVRPRKNGSWTEEIPHTMQEPIDRVAAAVGPGGLHLVFRPVSDSSVVKHCVLSPSSPGECGAHDLLNDQSVDILDIDLAAGAKGVMLAVSEVARGVTKAQFYDVVFNTTTKIYEKKLACSHDPKSDLELPRIAVGDSAWVGSVRQRTKAGGIEEWRVLVAPDSGSTCKSTNIQFKVGAAPLSTPANLTVGGSRGHMVFEKQSPHYASWDIANPPLTAPPSEIVGAGVLPGSSSITVLGDTPYVSAVQDPFGPVNDLHPARVWRKKLIGGFQQLPAPKPVTPDKAPYPKGKKPGTRSRVVAAPGGKRVHVLYDAHLGPSDEHVLIYYQCNVEGYK